MGETTIRILGEPTYRLMQRYSIGKSRGQVVPPGWNPGFSYDMGQLTSLALQQTQALRLVSGWCDLADFASTPPGVTAVVPVTFSLQIVSSFTGTPFFIRKWIPPFLPAAIGAFGPILSVQDDEFILGSDYGEQGSVSNSPMILNVQCDLLNNDAVDHTVNAELNLIWEMYDREVPSPRGNGGGSSGSGGGSSGGGTLQACPPPGVVLPDGECWTPSGLEALHP